MLILYLLIRSLYWRVKLDSHAYGYYLSFFLLFFNYINFSEFDNLGFILI